MATHLEKFIFENEKINDCLVLIRDCGVFPTRVERALSQYGLKKTRRIIKERYLIEIAMMEKDERELFKEQINLRKKVIELIDSGDKFKLIGVFDKYEVPKLNY